MQRLALASITALALLAPGIAPGQITFQYLAGPTQVSGNTATVPIYLQETDGGSATILGNASIKGLESFGIYIKQTSGSTANTIASFAPNPVFSFYGGTQAYPVSGASGSGGSTTSSSSASMPANSMDYDNTVSPSTTSNPATLVSAGVYQVALGTLTVNLGAPTLSTTFGLTSMNNPTFLDPGDNGSAQSDNAFTLPAGSGSYDIDGSGVNHTGAAGPQTWTGANSALSTFVVAPAVPEPGSMILTGLAASVIGLGVWLRRRRQTVDAAISA